METLEKPNFVKVTNREQKWLYSRGGRLPKDVLVDEDGDKFVLMSDGIGNEVKIYLPNGTQQ